MITVAIIMLLSASGMVARAASDRMIHGLVRDSLSNEPVPFAAIYVVGTDGGVLADDNGRFTVTVPRWPAILRVSVMGYTSRSVSVTPYSSTTPLSDFCPKG